MMSSALPRPFPSFDERALASTRREDLGSAVAAIVLLSGVWTTVVRNDDPTILTRLVALAAPFAVLLSGESERRRRRDADVSEVEVHAMKVAHARIEHRPDTLVARESRRARFISPRRPSPPGRGRGPFICCSAVSTSVLNDILACSTAKAGAPAPMSAAGSMAAPAGKSLEPRRTAQVLLVEDNDVNQRLAFALLDLRGHSVDVVEDGAEAVAAAAARTYDIVLMDVRMPGMDGMTATRLIRAAGGPSSKVPIIGMTADVYPEQIAACRSAGMDDHISKPLRRAQFYATLDRWLLRDATPSAATTRQVREAVEQGTGQAFDTEAYDRLLSYIGREKLDDILGRFAASLPERFGSGDGGPEALRLWAFDAHVVLSAAGMTGFDRLAAACRSLQSAEPGSELYRSSLDAARAARDDALLVLADLRRCLADDASRRQRRSIVIP